MKFRFSCFSTSMLLCPLLPMSPLLSPQPWVPSVPLLWCSLTHFIDQIVACRAVRRLTNYSSPGPEIYGYGQSLAALSYMNVLCPRSNNATSLAFRSQHSQGHPIEIPPRKIVDGVHVQMNTFISPSESESVRSLKHYGDGSPDGTAMRGTKGVPPEESAEGFDVETQGTLKSPPFL